METKPPPAGSAAMSGSSSAAGSAGSAAAMAPKPVTQDELAKRFDDCRNQWELGTWDAVQACFASDATRDQPGSGVSGESPATGKSIGLYVGQVLTFDDTGKNLEQMWKGFSDLKIATVDSIAAGDYVATTGTIDGTNDGDLPMMHVKKTGKKVSVPFLLVQQLAGGKVKSVWLFHQSASLASQIGADGTKK